MTTKDHVDPNTLIPELTAQVAQLRTMVISLVSEIDFVISGGDDPYDVCSECGLAGTGMLKDARRKAVELPTVAAELERLKLLNQGVL